MESEMGGMESELDSLMDGCGGVRGGCIGDIEYVENRWIGNYRFVSELGTGSSSKVVLACNIDTNEKVAIKIVPRRAADADASTTEAKCDQRVFREAVISSVLNHPHIVRLKSFLYNSTHYFLVFEYVQGRQLYDIIVGSGALDERHAQRYFRQLLSAIDYIHKNSIVHRDLKIENILIDEHDNVRLIDFGLSNFYDNKMLLNTFCGSLYFAAPELLSGQRYCGPEIDMWSLGVVLYVMLCGSVPFDDENVQGLQRKIREAEIVFSKSISSEAMDLIQGMVVAAPSSRMGLDQVIASEWVNKGQADLVNNYMIKRYPLDAVNERYVQAVSRAISFQFPNMEREVRRFHRICQEETGTLEQIYWSRRPVVSLYYLVSESLDNEDGAEVDGDELPKIIHGFVEFVLARERRMPVLRRETLFGDALCSPRPSGLPRIRRTYLRGFFRGIKVRHIGNQNALKKTVLDIFHMYNIAYEANDKSYFCSASMGDVVCHFKVSMFFNVLLNEYYLTVTSLGNEKRLFRSIYDQISAGIRSRA